MIHSFTVENFYSIKDPITINLESRGKRSEHFPELYSAKTDVSNSVSKIAFIGGKNASGKTNILRVLAFVRYMIINRGQSSIPFHPFATRQDDDSTISVDFSMDGAYVYTYLLRFNTKMILEEKMVKKYFRTRRCASTEVFSRIWDVKKSEYSLSFSSEEIPALKQAARAQILLNNNMKTTVIALFDVYDADDGVLVRVSRHWKFVLSNIMYIGTAESEQPLSDMACDELKTIYENKQVQAAANELLKRYDIGVSGIDKVEKLGPNKDQTVYGLHHGEKHGINFGMSVHLESNGTKRVAAIIRTIIATLVTGGVAVIDELDAFLHPEIYDDILNMFMSTNINSRGTQLIFSAHNYAILNKLDKQQIFLSSKSRSGETEAWRLDEVAGLRTDDNFYAKYIAGVYGGTPNITSSPGKFAAALKDIKMGDLDDVAKTA